MHVANSSTPLAAPLANEAQSSGAAARPPSEPINPAMADRSEEKAENRRRSISERGSIAKKLDLNAAPASPPPPERQSAPAPASAFNIPEIVVHLAPEPSEVETPAQRAAARKEAEWQNLVRKTRSDHPAVALRRHLPFLSPDELQAVFGAACGDELRQVTTIVNYDAVRFDNHYGASVWVLSHNARHPHFPIRTHEVIAYQAEQAGVDLGRVRYMVGRNLAGPQVREILSRYGFKHMDVMPHDVFDHLMKHTDIGHAAQKLLDAADKRVVSARLLLEDEAKLAYTLVLKLEAKAAGASPSSSRSGVVLSHSSPPRTNVAPGGIATEKSRNSSRPG